jgi:hypothetical protein
MIRKTFAAFAILACLAVPASAANVDKPQGDVILTVSGNVDAGGNKEVEFDRAMLEGMTHAVVKTSTPWFDGVSEFEGVRMDELMKTVGADGKTLVAVALNDYASELPIEDFAKHGVVLAWKRNGKDMDISEKGPLFVVYPYDSDPTLQAQMYYARSVWQVKEFIVK